MFTRQECEIRSSMLAVAKELREHIDSLELLTKEGNRIDLAKESELKLRLNIDFIRGWAKNRARYEDSVPLGDDACKFISSILLTEPEQFAILIKNWQITDSEKEF